MVVIEKKDKEKVLLRNGRFRFLGENKFDIIDNSDEVLKKLKDKGIDVKKIED